MTTPLWVAKELLPAHHFQMMSFLGVNKSTKKECHTITRVFGGIGLLSFPVEQTIFCLNMLVQHFGVSLALGEKFKAPLEAMHLEAGLNVNPLTSSYMGI